MSTKTKKHFERNNESTNGKNIRSKDASWFPYQSHLERREKINDWNNENYPPKKKLLKRNLDFSHWSMNITSC